ncbi:hypothetical protein QBC42DRAFT_268675 [Cladorrhinum samala]|uniref:Uncharacterized protein n=1 Tax=Cladorrhinum samala TaxID=585594 RepID=A0AAV9HQU9_9PEZI|nr:hypothetical protein QBC42DRAFT_268675 [Cladorrhinum samala]
MTIKTNVMPVSNSEAKDGREQKRQHPGSLLGLLQSSFESISHWFSSSRPWSKSEIRPTVDPEKRYVHVPTHAAVSHLKTTSSPSIRRANEVL